MLRRLQTLAGEDGVWFELSCPLVVETIVRWWRLLPVLLPAILCAYLANAAVALTADLLPDSAPGSAALAVGRGALLLLASWLGQLWAAAAVLLAATGGPVSAGRIGRWVRERVGLALFALAARAGLIYTPVVLFAAIGAASPGAAQQVGQVNLAPLAALILLPLALIFAALFALLPVGVLVVREGGVAEMFRRAREWGDASFVALLLWGGLITVLAAATSFLPLNPPVLFPNHAVGSLLWVLLPVVWLRVRRVAEPELTVEALTAELSPPA